ncbi:phosphatase PAP2 family protein [Methylobacterium sp. E-016]|uniref:phosphatase PAP2 family protein n=1 Tax=Methylobacterium sp. E-016 TaxID=2836556 RepID=UPI001FBA6E02|nr:phosphatase PAP2 family protein [Methylobacterium sp. E-016]MCJ2076899.1 phosphatase PAP2 family protein [Methylobacterium sp. E-016]
MAFDWKSAIVPVLACLALAGGVAVYSVWRPDERLAGCLNATAQLIALTVVGEPLSYAVACSGGPAWDATFMAWDRILGLDWQAYLAFVNARPWLAKINTTTYQSVMPQLIVVVVGLSLTGRLEACRTFVLAVALTAIAAIAISGLMPAETVFMHLGLSQATAPNVPFIDDTHILALRDGSLKVVSLTDGQGIIAFPSFHAALGAILARAFWHLPWARWPGLFVNLVMVVATPVSGGHYFVDVFAGLGLAGLAMATASLVERHGGIAPAFGKRIGAAITPRSAARPAGRRAPRPARFPAR